MKIAINDLSFQYSFFEYNEAMEQLKKFIYLCKKFESGEMEYVEEIVTDKIDITLEISPGCNLYKLIGTLRDTDKKRYLLSLLLNRNRLDIIQETVFEFDGKVSKICAWAVDHAVVSLNSTDFFSETTLNGIINKKSVTLRNLSETAHIYTYRHQLGVKIYKANSIKHKKDKDNLYGKGKKGSPMDLTDFEAQKLLNRSIWYKGRLYGRKNGNNYAFQKERDVYYHGYIADDLGEDIISELDKYKWQ